LGQGNAAISYFAVFWQHLLAGEPNFLVGRFAVGAVRELPRCLDIFSIQDKCVPIAVGIIIGVGVGIGIGIEDKRLDLDMRNWMQGTRPVMPCLLPGAEIHPVFSLLARWGTGESRSRFRFRTRFRFDFDFDPDFDFDFDYQLLFVGTIFKGAR
jgi:hypothetical protein